MQAHSPSRYRETPRPVAPPQFLSEIEGEGELGDSRQLLSKSVGQQLGEEDPPALPSSAQYADMGKREDCERDPIKATPQEQETLEDFSKPHLAATSHADVLIYRGGTSAASVNSPSIKDSRFIQSPSSTKPGSGGAGGVLKQHPPPSTVILDDDGGDDYDYENDENGSRVMEDKKHDVRTEKSKEYITVAEREGESPVADRSDSLGKRESEGPPLAHREYAASPTLDRFSRPRFGGYIYIYIYRHVCKLRESVCIYMDILCMYLWRE